MPMYTDPKQDAAWQEYEQSLGRPGVKPVGDNQNFFERNQSWDKGQFGQVWAAQQAQAKAQADKDSATNAANGNMQQAYGLAGGDLSRVASNPTDNLIRDQLSQKMTGQVLDPSVVPYDSVTKNAMMTAQGQTAASAEAARNHQMMDGIAANGGSAFDPGVRAALQQSLTQRQDQVSQAQLGIDQQANIANYQASTHAREANNNAQMQAAQSLQGQNNAQQQRETQASQNYQGLLTGQRFNTTGGATTAPQAAGFQAFQQGMARQNQGAAPTVATTPAPQPPAPWKLQPYARTPSGSPY